MNIIEKAIEKLEAEVDDLLREDPSAADRPAAAPHGAAAQGPGARSDRARAVGAEPRAHLRESSVAAHAPAQPSAGSASMPRDERAGARSERVEVDLHALTEAGFVTPLRDDTLLAEEFRIIKRPLLARATPGNAAHLPNGNLIIITSSLPGEGKTFNSVNLALSTAMEVDRTVLLVDADVAKSDVSRLFGVYGRQGLSSFLDGTERDLSKLLVRTNIESLSVLPSGPRHSRITELVASEQMRMLVAELSARYHDRVIIFDSPPLLATSGASVLASLMGQVVLVVEAVRTPQSALREARRRLGHTSNLSVVFNKQRGGHSRYDYGYGYGYGSAGTSLDSARPA